MRNNTWLPLVPTDATQNRDAVAQKSLIAQYNPHQVTCLTFMAFTKLSYRGDVNVKAQVIRVLNTYRFARQKKKWSFFKEMQLLRDRRCGCFEAISSNRDQCSHDKHSHTHSS